MKHPRQKSPAHLAFIRQLPCVVCGDNTSVEAAHIRMGRRWCAKRATGMSEKPDDSWAVPLCGKHHRVQHDVGEHYFWHMWHVGHPSLIDPVILCLALWRASGDIEAGEQIIREAKND